MARRRRRRVPEVLRRAYHGRARTLEETILSLLPYPPPSPSDCRCGGRICLGCAGSTHLLREEDSTEYRLLLTRAFCVLSSDAPPPPVDYLCSGSSQRSVAPPPEPLLPPPAAGQPLSASPLSKAMEKILFTGRGGVPVARRSFNNSAEIRDYDDDDRSLDIDRRTDGAPTSRRRRAEDVPSFFSEDKADWIYLKIDLARRMLRLGTLPDHFTFPLLLKACSLLPSFRRGAAFHSLVTHTAFDSNVFVCNALISMYARCGALDDAHHVFDEITQRQIDDNISWNSIVAAHAKSGRPNQALYLFACSANRHKSDIIGLVNILPACAALRAHPQAKQIHAYAVRNGHSSDLFVGNAIIDVYAKCRAMEDAFKVFENMGVRDVVSWNAMVTGYSQNGRFDDALLLFEKMRGENICLNVVTWSAVIAGYAQKGHGDRALDVFRQMQLAGAEANAVTVISLLSGCASAGALSQGMETHGHALRRWLMACGDDDGEGEDLMVQNALIDMYSKCKRFDLAGAIFDSIPLSERNVVTWTAMIGGNAQNGDANVSLELFSEMLMKSRSAVPNAFTISCALMACARLSVLRIGEQIHAYVIRNLYDGAVLHVANCLIDMYNKCGDLNAARNVFSMMPEKNAVSWTSLLTGNGMHGHGDDVLRVFERMQKVGFKPDGITFLVVLYACSHCGMIDQGMRYFDSMGRDYGVTAGAEHYACMIDLLGRAGRLDEAWEMIQRMPMKPTAIVWVSLLSACRTHANVELGEYAAAGLLELESDNDGSYTLLSNIYANAGRWRDVARIRSLMKKSGIRKRPGCSWIQGKKGTAAFFVGDRSHPQSPQIYALLGSLIERIRAIGYVPQTRFALHDVDDEEKTSLLSEHSEKLALAYGLLTSAPGIPIRITKNLRVCGDCHSAFTFISMVVDHEIILRDSSRFHHFKKGLCSCGGYW